MSALESADADPARTPDQRDSLYLLSIRTSFGVGKEILRKNGKKRKGTTASPNRSLRFNSHSFKGGPSHNVMFRSFLHRQP